MHFRNFDSYNIKNKIVIISFSNTLFGTVFVYILIRLLPWNCQYINVGIHFLENFKIYNTSSPENNNLAKNQFAISAL